MTIKNANLPAFPNEIYPEFVDDFMNGFQAGLNPTGITKREYFAAMCVSQAVATWYNHPTKELVQRSLEIADELLKQLEAK